MIKTKKIGVCEGRHQMNVEGYIFPQQINPTDVVGLQKTADNAVNELALDGVQEISLYITGLTVAVIATLNACKKAGVQVVAYHYDRESGNYFPQEVL